MSGLFASLTPATVVEAFTIARVPVCGSFPGRPQHRAAGRRIFPQQGSSRRAACPRAAAHSTISTRPIVIPSEAKNLFGSVCRKILRFAQNDKGAFSCRGWVSRPAGSDPHIVPFSAGHMGPALRRNEEMAGWKDKKCGAGGECTISCFANRQNLLYHEFV